MESGPAERWHGQSRQKELYAAPPRLSRTRLARADAPDHPLETTTCTVLTPNPGTQPVPIHDVERAGTAALYGQRPAFREVRLQRGTRIARRQRPGSQVDETGRVPYYPHWRFSVPQVSGEELSNL